jgi:hypothetical protein
VPTVDSLNALLAAPPRPPVDPDRFSSNTLFGEPGIYPQGGPMAPAVGPPTSEADAVAAVAEIGVDDAAARLAAPELVRRAPAPGPRAGLVALSVTAAAPVLDAFVAGATAADGVGLGPTAAAGRVVGPAAAGPAGTRVVNERYCAERPALLAGSLAHDLLWSGPGAGQYEEVTLHALCAFVYVQLLARMPALARFGTELARRQNSLAMTLLNSRHPGRADLAVRAPDGPGTIPGGAPGMATPDFWSIPFVSGRPAAGDAPALLGAVLRTITGAEPAAPLRYDDALGEWWSAHGVRGALSVGEQWRAAHALGLVDDAGSSRR